MFSWKWRRECLCIVRVPFISVLLALTACNGGGVDAAAIPTSTPLAIPTSTMPSPSPSADASPLPEPTGSPIPSVSPTSTPTPTLPPITRSRSDFNNDKCVGYEDYELLIEHYGHSSDEALNLYDSNGDGAINFDDYALLLQDWGSGCTRASGIANKDQFNFIVEITDSESNHLCAGVILDKSWVLSLASCTDGVDIASRRIVTSRIDSKASVDDSQIYRLQSFSYYPEDRSVPHAADLVLIKVDSDFVFGAGLSPIAIEPEAGSVGQTHIALGWMGQTEPGENLASSLQYVDTEMSDTITCRAAFPSGEVPTACIRARNNAFKFSKIDVGGPIVSISNSTDSQQGLSYRIRGLFVATDTPLSNKAVVANMLTSDQRVMQWVNGIIGQTSIYGDINGDGCVDDSDYQLYLSNNGLARADANPPEADVNSDNIVNFEDYAILLQQWGRGCSN